MPARLCYSPRAYVYTKNQGGAVINLSKWVISGQIDRRINQVSSATITLRNPYRRFTSPGSKGGVAFHPMDPITIWLQRINGYPVQVFTGYLDTTPYLQLYPGTITLTASCTLKRLLYTWFDPSLPYVISFLTKYGWINTGQGSIINPGTLGQSTTNLDAARVQDASFGKLLWGVLYEMGDWHDSNIYVEKLPDGISKRMAALAQSINKDQSTAYTEFQSFLQQVIGSGSQGSGGGPGAAGTGQLSASTGLTMKGAPIDATQLANLNVALSVASQKGASKRVMEAMVFAGIAENSWYDTTDPSNPTHHGVFQSTAFQDGQLAAAAAAWLTGGPSFQGGGGIAYAQAHPGASLADIAQAVEAGGSYANESGYAFFASEAQAIVAAYLAGGSQSAKSTNPSTKSQQGATAPAKDTSGSTKVNANQVINPIPGFTGFTYDYGIDASAPAGSAVLAPADCTVVQWIPNFYKAAGDGSGGLLLMQFTPPIPGAPTQYWYISEHVLMSSTTVGHHFKQGDTVATFGGQGGGNGIEIGWGVAPTGDPRYGASLGIVDHTSGVWGQHFQNYFSIGGGSPQQGGSTGSGSGNAGGAAGSTTNTNTAEAFVAELQFPSIEEQVTAIALGGEHKGLMHDQSLMPFVQQITQGSMRSFQSLPNGDFYAFYPDYFGEFGAHDPYWNIDDIEILDGGINLSDDSLATHVFAVGDNTWPVNNELVNMLFSAGSINIFNAFMTDGLLSDSPNGKQGMESVMQATEAVEFIKRYGARPLVQDYPMVRSNIFEMLLAYQQFMYAWASQFKTQFTFTFMPELFPGGKVSFASHGIQMYINSVTHSWDYSEAGFTTTADLSAPSLIAQARINPSDYPDLPPHFVDALVEPMRQGSAGSTGQSQQLQQSYQEVASVLSTAGLGGRD